VYHPDQIELIILDDPIPPTPPSMRACLVAGCPCKDARLLSRRRSAFFAALARHNGETADRVIGPEPGWVIPVAVEPMDSPEVAA
jgi:hypothetical protein